MLMRLSSNRDQPCVLKTDTRDSHTLFRLEATALHQPRRAPAAHKYTTPLHTTSFLIQSVAVTCPRILRRSLTRPSSVVQPTCLSVDPAQTHESENCQQSLQTFPNRPQPSVTCRMPLFLATFCSGLRTQSECNLGSLPLPTATSGSSKCDTRMSSL